ncbi:MAG: glycosyltransferase family 2 protein [Planctomycetota bacterium]
MTDCELSIVMPCLNEAETLAVCIQKARGYLERAGVDGEVVIADNGSTDGSQELSVANGARVVHAPRRGYGAALQAGIAGARGRYVIMGDADDSYDFSRLDAFVERLRAGDELVMGNRFRGGIAPGAMPPLHRYLGNPVLTTIGRVLFSSPCRDFHCGLRGFSREAILGLQLRTTGMEFASEMVVKATLRGLRVSEVPTTLSPDGRSRPPHLRSWRDGWRHLRFLLMLSPRWLFLAPGTLLILLGVTLMALVLPGPFEVRGVRLDVHTLVAAGAMLVLGTQTITFGILAKQFGVNAGILPESRGASRLRQVFALERAVVVGCIVFLVGFGVMLRTITSWSAAGLGDLDYQVTMRWVVPSVTAMTLGMQLVLSAFMSGVLDLNVDRDR